MNLPFAESSGTFVLDALFLLSLLSIGYVLFSGYALGRLLARLRAPSPSALPPMSLLKPLCGPDRELDDNLESFCRQDYPEYEIVFGVHTADDPAAATVRRLMARFPDRSITLVVERHRLGVNAKASNLASMAESARHDIFVVSDSDVRVEKDYLRTIASVFTDPKTGAASCLYQARPSASIISRLGAMYVNDWLLPSAAIALLYGRLSYCFGATMAVRRKALEAIGGFSTLAHYLADDYMLGRLLWRKGWRLRLVPTLIATLIGEETLGDLWRHELRWSRTIRNLRPWGYTFTLIGDAFTIALIFFVASGFAPVGGAVLLTAWAARGVQQSMIRRALSPYPGTPTHNLLLIPLRDILRAGLWCASHVTHRLHWRDEYLDAPAEGRVRRIANPRAKEAMARKHADRARP